MEISVLKTKVMVVSPVPAPAVAFLCNGNPVEQVTCFKYLGLHFHQSGAVAHLVTPIKSKAGGSWAAVRRRLYDCLFTFLQSLQCCGGNHGFLRVQLQKQVDEVCHNHTPSRHTSIIISQIRFADDNFTYIDCNGMRFKDALGLTVGDYPESCSWPTSDLLLFQIEDSLTDQCRCISLKHA